MTREQKIKIIKGIQAALAESTIPGRITITEAHQIYFKAMTGEWITSRKLSHMHCWKQATKEQMAESSAFYQDLSAKGLVTLIKGKYTNYLAISEKLAGWKE